MALWDSESTTPRGEVLWYCICDCNTPTLVPTSYLRTLNTRSCGCLSREVTVRGRFRGFSPNSKKPPGIAARNSKISSYRYFAKTRGYAFTLTVPQLETLFKGNCRYCSAGPSQVCNGGRDTTSPYTYNGIDRTDNAKGYIPTNVVSCCKRCNFAKGTKSVVEFMDWVRRVYSKSILHITSLSAQVPVTSISNIVTAMCRRRPYQPPQTFLLKEYKASARKLCLDFTLPLDVFNSLLKGDCTYCGAPPTQKAKHHPSFLYNGIDRVDSSQGYISTNVVPCCRVCNIAKNNMSLDAFKAWVVCVFTAASLQDCTERRVA